MNPYVISPEVVKTALDPQLSKQFGEIISRLNWKPLTTNLESCEDAPYLYFRIMLKLRPGSATYAGFSTGAPFMLTRDQDAKKRAFFLRHWVRKTPSHENANAPSVSLNHMSIACNGEHLLVRVTIDRPLAAEDCFKSIPFATWMFQVVQVDAIIAELPGMRFAFAIERTVTAEERDAITASGLDLPSKGPKVKQVPLPPQPARPNMAPQQIPQAPPTARPARPLLGQPSGPNPVMAQNVAPRPNMAYTQVNQRPNPASFQPNPYAYASARAAPLQMRPNVAPRPPYGQPIAKAPSRMYNRAMNIPQTSAPPPVDTLRPVMHPYLRLWEDRDLDDPYEPIFFTEDQKFEEKARRSWLVEQSEDHAKRFEYENLIGIPSADYPSYYCDGTDISLPDGEPDIEVVVHRKKRAKPEMSELTSDSGDEDSEMRLDAEGKYAAAVIAASEYNAALQNERAELRRWLVEDEEREEEESEEEEEEEEPDSESSD